MTWLLTCATVAFALAVVVWLAMANLMASGTRYVDFRAELADGWNVVLALFLVFLALAVAVHWVWRGLAALFGG